MKTKIAIVATLLFFTSHLVAQESRPEPTQNPDAPYRLFNTKNIYTLLKLDTRDGRIWQVQWGGKGYRFIEPLNSEPLTSAGRAGRFSLYPTSNIYTFILLDQEKGNAWHIQWGKTDERFILPIDDIVKE
jgi:hypothetical protein